MHPDIAWRLHQQRLQDQHRRHPVVDRMAVDPRTRRARSSRSVRRAVGRTIVRIGMAIEAEPRQPVASR